MAGNRLSIKKVAELFDISPDTVRYYEKIGLLPVSRGEGNNYRYYNLEEVNSLYSAITLRSLGVPIRQMQDFQRSGELRTLSEGLDETEALLDKEMEKLMEQQRKLRRLRAQFSQISGNVGKISLRQSPKWWFLQMEGDTLDIPDHVRLFYRVMNEKDALPSFTFLLPAETFLKGERTYSRYGLLLEEALELPELELIPLPPMPCVYTVYQGKEETLPAAYDDLRLFANKYHYTPAGDLIERFVISTADTDFFEIWMPVTPS